LAGPKPTFVPPAAERRNPVARGVSPLARAATRTEAPAGRYQMRGPRLTSCVAAPRLRVPLPNRTWSLRSRLDDGAAPRLFSNKESTTAANDAAPALTSRGPAPRLGTRSAMPLLPRHLLGLVGDHNKVCLSFRIGMASCKHSRKGLNRYIVQFLNGMTF